MTKTVSAVVVCAGNSSRMCGVDKIFSEVCGKPVIIYTLEKCVQSKFVRDIIVVTKPENFSVIKSLAQRHNIVKPLLFAQGGKIRSDSALNGVSKSTSDFVAIMDGARPLVSPEAIDKTCMAAFECGGAALGTPMTDTVKKIAENGEIICTVPRRDLVRIQTPQVFEREKYISLATRALSVDYEFTDDCSIFEYYGEKVKTVLTDEENLKITYKHDLDNFERLVMPLKVRVGHGYDVHRLVEGRKLFLCGVQIDFELGLLGHSDADVALHALMDSMLGAAALGDIGKLFPDTKNSFKDISSMILLERVWERISGDYVFGNCDVTIIAQKPKLLPHIPKMRENIAKILETDIDNVNVKATTEEKLGFTGSLEGISAHAVCTLYKR